MRRIAKEHRKVKPFFGLNTRSILQDLTGYDPVETRERERGEREREQAKLYRLVVLIAAISAAASIASVAVAALNAG